MKELLERAERAEAKESKETLDIPAELVRREQRVAALQQARQVIEERAKEMAAAAQTEYEAKQAKRQAQRDAGQKPRGPEPTPPSPMPDAKAQYNFTDPDSRIMKAGSGQHFEQAYNAQADGGTSLWNHQRSDGIPALPASGASQSRAGMDAGLRELQPQADVHAQKPGGSGVKTKESGLSGAKNWVNRIAKPIQAMPS